MEPRLQQHKLTNVLQSALLIATMAALLGALGWVLGGGEGTALALIVCAVAAVVGPRVSPALVLRLYRARPLGPAQAPQLCRALEALSRSAELPRPPQLYYIPSRLLNAFALGGRSQSAIAVTDGLLHSLTPRELLGVLAHEVSHIRHNDTWVMNLADAISRLTQALSQVGWLLLFVFFPLVMFGMVAVSPLALVLLIAAPAVAALLQLALSRTREYDADLGAVRLTGDPQGLAAALAKLERCQGGWLERVFIPGSRAPEPGWLRTHPPTAERVRRLLALARREPALVFGAGAPARRL